MAARVNLIVGWSLGLCLSAFMLGQALQLPCAALGFNERMLCHAAAKLNLRPVSTTANLYR